MAVMWVWGFVCGLAGLCWAAPTQQPTTNMELAMPDVQPQVDDTYLCQPYKMPKDPLFLTGFVPHANMSTAHHMLIYGCKSPGETDKVWNCGEMASSSDSLDKRPVCKDGLQIIYAWAMDAPELSLPKGVAFEVGGDTDIQWLVLQVHYKDVSSFIPPLNGKDHSGITVKTTTESLPKRAGVYLLGTGGSIPAKSTVYMETACSVNDNLEVHPFAYRVHAHIHGKVVSGYRVRNGKWTELGRASPQKPQMFYPVTHNVTVEPGDMLAARCTMKNDEDRNVDIGSTQHDEMCNFYVMYWVDGDQLMSQTNCFTDGPPTYNWKKEESLAGIAPVEASMDPTSGELFEQTERLENEVESAMKGNMAEMDERFKDILEELERANQQGEDGSEVEYKHIPGGEEVDKFRPLPGGGSLEKVKYQLLPNGMRSESELQEMETNYGRDDGKMFEVERRGQPWEIFNNIPDDDNDGYYSPYRNRFDDEAAY